MDGEQVCRGKGERETYLERLLAWLVRVFVNRNVIFRPRQMFMLERIKRSLQSTPRRQYHHHPTITQKFILLAILFTTTTPNLNTTKKERTHPFTVNRHLRFLIDPQILNLPNLPHLLHIRRITPRPENDRDLRARVDVVGCDEGSGGVVDEGDELHGDLLLVEVQSGWSRGRGGSRRDVKSTDEEGVRWIWR